MGVFSFISIDHDNWFFFFLLVFSLKFDQDVCKESVSNKLYLIEGLPNNKSLIFSVSNLYFLLQVVAQTIRSCLDELPGSTRTQIGFATFDSTIHFYNMKVENIGCYYMFTPILILHAKSPVSFTVDFDSTTNDGGFRSG